MDTPNGDSLGDGIVLILSSRLALARGLRWPIKRFIVDGTTYTEIGLGGLTGFYDWLRDENAVLLGVRYWPSEPNSSLCRAIYKNPYVQMGELGELSIYFSPERTHDEQRSNDQEFLYDAVFSSDDGTWAIVFDISELHDKDLDRLANLKCNTWVQPEDINQ